MGPYNTIYRPIGPNSGQIGRRLAADELFMALQGKPIGHGQQIQQFSCPRGLLGARRNGNRDLSRIAVRQDRRHVVVESNMPLRLIDDSSAGRFEWWRETVAPCPSTIPECEIEVEDNQLRLGHTTFRNPGDRLRSGACEVTGPEPVNRFQG